MKHKKRYLFLLGVGLIVCGLFGCTGRRAPGTGETPEGGKTTELIFWCDDKELVPYLEEAGREYEEKTGVKVHVTSVDSVEYVEQINEASLKKKGPDVYLLGSENLKKAKLAGLTEKNRYEKLYSEKNYPAVALHAASWDGELNGYPFFYDVSLLLYRSDVFKTAPATFEALSKEKGASFRWDSSDVFYNFAFVGSAVTFEEPEGTAAGSIVVDKEKLLPCFTEYQKLARRLSLEPSGVSEEKNVEDFLNGKLYAMLGKSTTLRSITEAGLNLTGQIAYGVSAVPDFSAKLKTSPLSTTTLIEVNGLSLNKKEAAGFARFLTYDNIKSLYRETGRFPARRAADPDSAELAEILKVYETSVSMPRATDFGSSLMELQTSLERVFRGQNAKKEVERFEEVIAQ